MERNNRKTSPCYPGEYIQFPSAGTSAYCVSAFLPWQLDLFRSRGFKVSEFQAQAGNTCVVMVISDEFLICTICRLHLFRAQAPLRCWALE
jgi:hypothetical protein